MAKVSTSGLCWIVVIKHWLAIDWLPTIFSTWSQRDILPSNKGWMKQLPRSVATVCPWWLYKEKKYLLISIALPWSIITLFTSYPPILSVTTKASSCGCMVPCLSTSEKLNTNGTFILALFGIKLESSSEQQDTDIILKEQDPILPEIANMTFMVPRGGLGAAFPWNAEFVWLPRPLEWCKRCFSFLSQTNYSKWSHKFLQSSVVCPWSWW